MKPAQRGKRGRRPGLGGARRLLALVACLALTSACGSGREVIVHTADGRGATEAEIDAHPLWLLPPGGVGYLNLDASRAHTSQLGQRLLRELDARLPLPESSGFARERDLERVSLVTYSMRGVDFAGVATGRFDRERIHAAAVEYRGGPVPGGLRRSDYAGHALFSAFGVGFVVVTPKTAVFGNETGIRRCLDRISDGRVQDDLPAWASELAQTQNATYSVGLDLSSGAAADAIAKRLSFLNGATMVRGVGNFDPPGLHLAGTVTHAEEAQSRSAVQSLLSAGNQVNVWGRLLGFGQPIHTLQAQSSGTDTQFVLALEASSIESLMSRFLPPPPAQPSGPGWASRELDPSRHREPRARSSQTSRRSSTEASRHGSRS